MALELTPIAESDAPELARICYTAFGTLHDRHNIPKDFPSVDVTQMLMGMLLQRQDCFGVAARLGGRIVGSNFLMTSDDVAGVGPITVDPAVQARGIGRALMQAVLDNARDRGISHVRLFQEAVNTTSLSLYTSLGFAWRDAAALMELTPPEASAPDDPSIRPLTAADLSAVESISVRHYHHSRRNEAAAALEWQFPGFVRERGGEVVAYHFPGFFGHGFAPTIGDMLALFAHEARHTPPPFHRLLLPMSQSDFYRAALGSGHRTLKVMNYMSVGPYTPPREVWIPSIGN